MPLRQVERLHVAHRGAAEEEAGVLDAGERRRRAVVDPQVVRRARIGGDGMMHSGSWHELRVVVLRAFEVDELSGSRGPWGCGPASTCRDAAAAGRGSLAWAQGARDAATRGVPFFNVEGLVAHAASLAGKNVIERRDALPGVAVLAVDLLDVVRQAARHERRARGRAVRGVVAVQLRPRRRARPRAASACPGCASRRCSIPCRPP